MRRIVVHVVLKKKKGGGAPRSRRLGFPMTRVSERWKFIMSRSPASCCRLLPCSPRRYQSQPFTVDEEKGDDGVLGREDVDQLREEQFGLLSYIVREYIIDGAPNEVNLR